MKIAIHKCFGQGALIVLLFIGQWCFAQNIPSASVRVIVLCDLSKSVSIAQEGYNSRIGDMKNICGQILRHYPPGSEIGFYFISSNAVFVPFAQFNSPVVKQRSAGRVRKQLTDLEIKIYKRIDSARTHTEKQTCVLTSVENAFDYFAASADGKQRENELFVFSDMLEQCRETSVGRIWMNEQQAGSLTVAEKKKINQYLPKSNWRDLKVRISILNTSSYMSIVMKNNIENTWSDLFARMLSLKSGDKHFSFLSTTRLDPYVSYRKSQ